MNRQLEELSAWIHAGDPGRSDDPPDLSPDELPATPVAAKFNKAEFVAAGGPEDWDDTAPESNALAKRDSHSEYVKNHFAISEPFGSAAAMSVARTEETTSPNGDIWKSDYAGDGSLIRTHVVNGDGGPLSKRDGGDVEIRKLDDGDFWMNTFRNGELVEMELCYANGDTERFDAEGNPLGE